MSYPKQPGQDAQAHRALAERSLVLVQQRDHWRKLCSAQTEVLRDLERWMEASIKLTPHDRLDWLQAFSEVWLPQIRAALEPRA